MYMYYQCSYYDMQLITYIKLHVLYVTKNELNWQIFLLNETLSQFLKYMYIRQFLIPCGLFPKLSTCSFYIKPTRYFTSSFTLVSLFSSSNFRKIISSIYSECESRFTITPASTSGANLNTGRNYAVDLM